jgi:hypothetical protein
MDGIRSDCRRASYWRRRIFHHGPAARACPESRHLDPPGRARHHRLCARSRRGSTGHFRARREDAAANALALTHDGVRVRQCRERACTHRWLAHRVTIRDRASTRRLLRGRLPDCRQHGWHRRARRRGGACHAWPHGGKPHRNSARHLVWRRTRLACRFRGRGHDRGSFCRADSSGETRPPE